MLGLVARRDGERFDLAEVRTRLATIAAAAPTSANSASTTTSRCSAASSPARRAGAVRRRCAAQHRRSSGRGLPRAAHHLCARLHAARPAVRAAAGGRHQLPASCSTGGDDRVAARLAAYWSARDRFSRPAATSAPTSAAFGNAGAGAGAAAVGAAHQSRFPARLRSAAAHGGTARGQRCECGARAVGAIGGTAAGPVRSKGNPAGDGGGAADALNGEHVHFGHLREDGSHMIHSRWFVLALLCIQPCQAASPAPAAAENGMVVTAQQHATRIGVEVLARGGNAMDAAVAVGYALSVVYPAAGNLGGGGFMTVQFADGRKTFIDFRETAPLAATANMYLDAQGNVVPDLSTRGYLAVAVPGTVSGLEYVREKYGTLPRAALIAPAIALAEKGFVLDQGDVDILHEATDDFRKDAAERRDLPGRQPAARSRRPTRAKGSRAHLAQHQPRGQRRLLPGRDGRRAAGRQPRRQRHPLAGGFRCVSHARTRSGRMRLSRLSCRRRAAAFVGRHNVVRDAQRARGLPVGRLRIRLRARSAFRNRSDAARLRGPQQLPGRPGVRAESDRPAARQELRETDPRQHRSLARGQLRHVEARHRRARRHAHDALFHRRSLRQRGRRHLHA